MAIITKYLIIQIYGECWAYTSHVVDADKSMPHDGIDPDNK